MFAGPWALALAAIVTSLAGCTLDDANPRWWSLVLLPDTQHYTDKRPEVLDAQTWWIADHVDDLHIRYVLQLGDVTEWNDVDEWERASHSMAALDHLVPYAVVPGNHDYDAHEERSSRISEYFPPARTGAVAPEGGVFEQGNSENTFHLFDAGGDRWLVLALEWGPRDEVLAWAGDVLDAYPDRQAILVTHAYLYRNGYRYDWDTWGKKQKWNPHRYSRARWPVVNDGQEIWDKLISHHANVRFVFSAHVLGKHAFAHRASFSPTGTLVHQVLANYQSWQDGGDGYLRVVRFYDDFVSMESYSPYVDSFLLGDEDEYELAR
jgi:3',5'-cyclic AMP phosphodiesterase CpdA